MIPQTDTWFDANLPSGWGTTSLRAAFVEKKERSGEVLDNYLSLTASAGVIPYAEKGDVGNKAPEDMSKCKKVAPGDFVLNSMNFGIGSFGVSKYEGVCSSVYLVLEPQGNLFNVRFLERVFELSSFQKHAQSLGNGILAHRAAFGWDKLRTIQVPVPPRAEQDAIVEFLDRELDLIDRMLAKQHEIKSLLSERKTSYILRLISKGTRKERALKNSGEPWLGSIPSSWELSPIRRLSRVQRGASPRPIDDERYFDPEGEYGWVRISDVTASGMVLTKTEQKLSALGASSSVKMKPGDLFLSIAGSYGKAAIAGEKVCIHDGFVWFPELAQRNINSEWLFWVFESGKLFDGLGKLGTQVNLNTSIVGNVKIGVPSFEEQVEIADHLRNFALDVEELSAANGHYTNLLNERRTALISGALSGKIDVGGV